MTFLQFPDSQTIENYLHQHPVCIERPDLKELQVFQSLASYFASKKAPVSTLQTKTIYTLFNIKIPMGEIDALSEVIATALANCAQGKALPNSVTEEINEIPQPTAKEETIAFPSHSEVQSYLQEYFKNDSSLAGSDVFKHVADVIANCVLTREDLNQPICFAVGKSSEPQLASIPHSLSIIAALMEYGHQSRD